MGTVRAAFVVAGTRGDTEIAQALPLFGKGR